MSKVGVFRKGRDKRRWTNEFGEPSLHVYMVKPALDNFCNSVNHAFWS
jgi:hypothetical protein